MVLCRQEKNCKRRVENESRLTSEIEMADDLNGIQNYMTSLTTTIGTAVAWHSPVSFHLSVLKLTCLVKLENASKEQNEAEKEFLYFAVVKMKPGVDTFLTARHSSSRRRIINHFIKCSNQ